MRHCNELHAELGECPFQCLECLQKFKNIYNFKAHAKNVHQDGEIKKKRPYKCQFCRKSFFHPSHLRDHEGAHFKPSGFGCGVCGKKYSTSYSLELHRVNAHDTAERPKCELCGKTFASPTLLKKHRIRVHERDERLKCPDCGRVFIRRDKLLIHRKKCQNCDLLPPDEEFEDESVVRCKLCDNDISPAEELANHLRDQHGVTLIVEKGQNSSQAQNSIEVVNVAQQISVGQQITAGTSQPISFGQLNLPHNPTEFSISEAAEALLRNLTPQPDYLLRCLTPIPLEVLDDFMGQ